MRQNAAGEIIEEEEEDDEEMARHDRDDNGPEEVDDDDEEEEEEDDDDDDEEDEFEEDDDEEEEDDDDDEDFGGRNRSRPSHGRRRPGTNRRPANRHLYSSSSSSGIRPSGGPMVGQGSIESTAAHAGQNTGQWRPVVQSSSSSAGHSGGEQYSIDDLPRSVLLTVLDPNFSGTVVTSAECGVRGRAELLLVDNWAILLVDRKSPFVSKNAKDFLNMLWALQDKKNNMSIRGAILCRESSYHRKMKIGPFARSTQDFLLKHGVVLLSIPDGTEDDDADHDIGEEDNEDQDEQATTENPPEEVIPQTTQNTSLPAASAAPNSVPAPSNDAPVPEESAPQASSTTTTERTEPVSEGKNEPTSVTERPEEEEQSPQVQAS